MSRTCAAILAATTLLLTIQTLPSGASATGRAELPVSPAAEDAAGDEAPKASIDEAIVVSAHRHEASVDEVGSSVTVIDRPEIERRAETTVLELLRTVPGLEVTQSGGPGKVSSVFIRGGASAHTLVLIDGVRVNNNLTGAFDFSDLTTDNVERIEVLRGPQSSLYGSEAVAGVVSITTRRGQGPAAVSLFGEIGSDDHSRWGLGVHGGAERWSYSLTASSIDTGGISAASEAAGNREPDPWRNETVSGRLGREVLEDGRLELVLRYTDSNTAIDGFLFGVGPADDLNAVQERTTALATLGFTKRLTRRWKQTVSIARSDDTLRGRDPDNPFGNFRTEGRSTELLALSEVTLSPVETLTFGARVEDRSGESVGSYDSGVDLRSLFAENRWSWRGRYHLGIGVRTDDHSLFGSETTYRVTASLGLRPGVRLHGTIGTGFRAPTFDELFFPGLGNLDLRPETSTGRDLGIELATASGRLTVDLTGFDNTFEDLIQFTFPAGFANVAEAAAKGLELSLTWRPSPALSLRASHTVTDSEDRATGRSLPRRPENRTVAELAVEPGPRWRGSVALVAVSDRLEFDGSPMDDYLRVDLSVDYRGASRLAPYLRVDNLFDEEYAEIPGFTSPGIGGALGLRFTP